MHMKAEGGGSSHVEYKEGAREDSNTVESETEQANYTKNAIQYQVVCSSLTQRFAG